jgi:hypothetical protein
MFLSLYLEDSKVVHAWKYLLHRIADTVAGMLGNTVVKRVAELATTPPQGLTDGSQISSGFRRHEVEFRHRGGERGAWRVAPQQVAEGPEA